MKKQGPKQRPKKGNMDKHGKTWKMQAPYKALLGLCLALAWFFSHFVLIKNWISQKSWQPQKASNKHTQREEKVSSCSVRFFLCLLLARSCVANFWLCFFCFCSAFFWLGWGSLLSFDSIHLIVLLISNGSLFNPTDIWWWQSPACTRGKP